MVNLPSNRMLAAELQLILWHFLAFLFFFPFLKLYLGITSNLQKNTRILQRTLVYP